MTLAESAPSRPIYGAVVGGAVGAAAAALLSDGVALILDARSGPRIRDPFVFLPVGVVAAAVFGAVFGAGISSAAGIRRRLSSGIVATLALATWVAFLPTVAMVVVDRISATASLSFAKTSARYAVLALPFIVAAGSEIFARRGGRPSSVLRVFSLVAIGIIAAFFDRKFLVRSDGLLRTQTAILLCAAGAALTVPIFARRKSMSPIPGVIVGALFMIALIGFGVIRIVDARDFLRMLVESKTICAKSAGGLLLHGAEIAESGILPVPVGIERFGVEDPIPAADLDALLAKRRDFNVVVITWDTVRADHVGHLGYPRETTPNVDRLAAEGVSFSYAWAQYPSSRYSIESFLTSRYASRTASFAADHPSPIPPVSTPLAADLRSAGRTTIGVTALHPGLIDRLFGYFPNGFDTFMKGEGDEPLSARAITNRALELLSGVGTNRPFHLWAHYFDPHEPFVAHADYPFGSQLIDRYDSEIAYSDAEIGRLIDVLRRRDDWNRTIVVVHADHGEEFFEHGGIHHGSTLYDEQIRVPLVIRVPGISPRVVTDAVGLVDVKPTILEILGRSDPNGDDGQSLIREMLGKRRTVPRAPAFAEIHEGSSLGVRADAVGDGTMKVIADRRTSTRSNYHVAVDPKETNPIDLPDGEPNRLLAALAAFATLRGGVDAPILNLASGDPAIRRSAFLKLEADDATDALGSDHWKRLVLDSDESVRRSVLEFLVRERTPGAFDALVESVRAEKNPDLARHAVFGLAVAGDRRAIRFFRDGGAVDPQAPMILIARGMLGDGDVEKPLQDLFFQLSGESRLAALSAGAAVGLAPASRMVRSLLGREVLPGWVEPATLEIASRAGDPSILPIYHERLVRTPSRPVVWRSVMDAAARFPVRDIVPILRLATRSPSDEVRRRARAKLESEGLVSLLPQLSALEEDLTAAENVVEVDRDYVDAAEILRRGAEKAHQLGLADWGLAVESWHCAMEAGRRDIAKKDAEYWSQRFAWPDFARRLMERLAKIAASEGETSSRLDWIAFDPVVRPNVRWFGAVAVRCEKGALPTGDNLRECGVALVVRSAGDGAVLCRRSAPIPLGGILEGEVQEIAMYVDLPILPAGRYEIAIRISATGRDLSKPIVTTIDVD